MISLCTTHTIMSACTSMALHNQHNPTIPLCTANKTVLVDRVDNVRAVELEKYPFGTNLHPCIQPTAMCISPMGTTHLLRTDDSDHICNVQMWMWTAQWTTWLGSASRKTRFSKAGRISAWSFQRHFFCSLHVCTPLSLPELPLAAPTGDLAALTATLVCLTGGPLKAVTPC